VTCPYCGTTNRKIDLERIRIPREIPKTSIIERKEIIAEADDGTPFIISNEILQNFDKFMKDGDFRTGVLYGARRCKECGSKDFDIIEKENGKRIRILNHKDDCRFIKRMSNTAIELTEA
jgi:DNA-directed RNA polymerase subunit RPC12/RpoP